MHAYMYIHAIAHDQKTAHTTQAHTLTHNTHDHTNKWSNNVLWPDWTNFVLVMSNSLFAAYCFAAY